jgi:hypothetical protein
LNQSVDGTSESFRWIGRYAGMWPTSRTLRKLTSPITPLSRSHGSPQNFFSINSKE